MIDRQQLLSDLQKLLGKLETDLLERTESTDVPEIGETLRSEYDRARQSERTAQSYEEWKRDTITQVAAAWVLSCVFVRFLEDNRLIDPPKVSGSLERLQRARDEHELYFRGHPSETDRDYLLAVFSDLAKLPGTKDVFGEHNPIRELPSWLSGDAAGELLRFFQKIDANTGTLIHDFTDSTWDTRFLGDLYQDLSETSRKKYALLQTPEFVEEFILDRTLEPALDEFGLDAVPLKDTDGNPTSRSGFRMIDPACGSGHFLLEAFRRILNRWLKQEPGANIRDLVQRALDSIHGVDLNPYAVAIARFRLLLASMQVCGLSRLAEAPAFHFNLTCGDSLLHGSPRGDQLGFGFAPIDHAYVSENQQELNAILRPYLYHAVVGNPPYISVKDKALNRAYRQRYPACRGKYVLTVPFLQRLMDLAKLGQHDSPAGYVGAIIGNSFMRQQFGITLVEEFLPRWTLTHVIDTAGAYIPGHGTPTVILFLRHAPPVGGSVRTVMGIQGEPNTPSDASQGKVWRAIVEQVDHAGSQSAFVSVSDVPRDRFHIHPWSIGGGGASELKQYMDDIKENTLGEIAAEIGIMGVTGADDVYVFRSRNAAKHIDADGIRNFVLGEGVRDWSIDEEVAAVWPYDEDLRLRPLESIPSIGRELWKSKAALLTRRRFGTPMIQKGAQWYEWQELYRSKLASPLTIAFANVATHNHFVLDRNGRLFNSHAMVIKLPLEASLEEHVALLGVLNSSSACFWIKQVAHNKGSTVDKAGARQRTAPFEDFYEISASLIKEFPLPSVLEADLSAKLERLGALISEASPRNLSRDEFLTDQSIKEGHLSWIKLRETAIAIQEELDWRNYELFGLTDESLTFEADPPPIQFGQRAFEFVMARKIGAGVLSTNWFERHGANRLTEMPSHWPDDYRRLVQRRIELIEQHRDIGLIEQPEYKRRWNSQPWPLQLKQALRDSLLDLLESYFDIDGRLSDPHRHVAKLPVGLASLSKVAEVARKDHEFMQLGELYMEDSAFEVEHLVCQLVEAEVVPLLPIQLYKPSGMRKHAEWERAWDLQRREDNIYALTCLAPNDPRRLTVDQAQDLKHSEVGEIPSPSKYISSDFISSAGARYWSLRGTQDVPKERWISFPYCEGPDGTLVVAWAGYDHLQLAKAISTYYVDVQERFGGRDDPRLVQLLACVIELIPWIKQWHNEPDSDFDGIRMGDYYESFVQDEARQMGKTLAEIKAWQPPQRARSRRTRG